MREQERLEKEEEERLAKEAEEARLEEVRKQEEAAEIVRRRKRPMRQHGPWRPVVMSWGPLAGPYIFGGVG